MFSEETIARRSAAVRERARREREKLIAQVKQDRVPGASTVREYSELTYLRRAWSRAFFNLKKMSADTAIKEAREWASIRKERAEAHREDLMTWAERAALEACVTGCNRFLEETSGRTEDSSE